jgi:hypothetical protein
LSKKIEEVYQQIADLINATLDDTWSKAWIRARLHEDNAEFDLLYQKDVQSEPLQFNEAASPVIGKIYKSFKEMREMFKLSGKPLWHTATFTLESTGRFKLDFEYD